MKKVLIPLIAVAAVTTALGQGKVRFENDSGHVVGFTFDTNLLKPADASLADQPVPAGGSLPSGGILVADLYGGTSSNSLALQATTSFSGTPGMINPINVALVGIPGGSTAYFEVEIRDSAFVTEAASLLGGSYGGNSVIFSVPAGTITYPSIVSGWPIPPQPGPPTIIFAVTVSLIPEPSAVALGGLGIVAMWLRCRRNKHLHL